MRGVEELEALFIATKNKGCSNCCISNSFRNYGYPVLTDSNSRMAAD